MADNTKNEFVRSYSTTLPIDADTQRPLPTRIMLMKTGSWKDSWKGKLTITEADLREYKQHFDEGIGIPGNGKTGLPIDFSHEDHKEAGAWIKGLEVAPSDDPIEAAKGVMALYSNPTEWTEAGKASVGGGNFKCISPSFFPAGRGGWEDPEDTNHVVDNVIVGAGFTNIPFFAGLSPVMASNSSEQQDGRKNVIFISASKQGEKRMTLDEVRLVDADKLTDEQKQFLVANKDQLSGDELKKFDLAEVTADKHVEADKTTGDAVSPEDAQLLADIKSGKVKTVKEGEAVVDASRLSALEETAKQYQTEKATSVVEGHVKRGAIKADTQDRWVSRLLAATGDERKALEEDLAALPANEQIGQELGDDKEIEASTGKEMLAKLAAARVAKAKEEGKDLDIVTAQQEVLASNEDLAAQIRDESKIN